MSNELVDGVGSRAGRGSEAAAAATAGVVVVTVAVGGGFDTAGRCDCDVVAFGDFLINGELPGMRFVDGGLALLAGICGGLSAPA